ncbi:hypothetical protein [Streptomyces sp. NPDC059828]|uniref:hypothetical protein n=1 Tax=Streptomyces sp. NPDC059828 TaxID=3346965 RepID=UPI0036682A7C
MTRSGQGDETQHPGAPGAPGAARPAYEGVVLPADSNEPWIPGVSGEQVAPAGGAPWGAPWGPAQGQSQPQPQSPQYGGDAAATQYIPPVPGGADAAATQYIPPVPGGADAAATQYIPPVQATPSVPRTAGPLPPEAPVESTQFLGLRPPAAGGGDAEATQYLPPVPQQQTPPQAAGAPYGVRPGAPADPQPPAGFENLFRSDSPQQQMPRPTTEPQRHPLYAAAPQHPYPAGPSGPAGPSDYDEPQGRRPSRLPLIAAVVVGCAVVGLGVSAVMFGGDDKDADSAPVAAASTPAAPTKGAAAPADDPAKAQAEELDKLLADSNNSRASVIRSVESIKGCDNLDQAARDLRAAADQRRSLVTRLKGVEVDKLQNHEQLTKSLTTAWEASASADDHYAEWAGQVDGKKGCRGGKARQTKDAAQGNRASGEASKAKREASGLWNAIATKYGLTQREATQL